MIPEIGHFALWLALGVAVVLGTVPMLGAARGREDWMAVARPAARALFVLVVVAMACLVISFVRHDFSVLYVASNSNSALPLQYRIAGVWGGHEGSLLLWMLMLCVWMVAVAQFSRHLPMPVLSRILAVMGLISLGFLLFMLVTSNPFERLFPVPADGRDLNPLLQDPGMVFHPPTLYMGYVGFSVAFSFAVAALIGGNLDANWARWTRPWTNVAWVFLTVGIAMGSWWAYYELGWGGWWFWDPVENASFMPWLVGTALIHSLAVTEKRGGFKMWTALLAILAFSLSLLGTFIVRSGVLSSVHAFASDPARGIFILGFLALVVGGSLLLFALRAPKVGTGGAFDMVSRESMLLANNVLLLVAAAAVLLGTLYPLVLDALGMGKISVGPPYFDAVFVPLMAPALFLMGIGPMARWRSAQVGDLARKLRWALAVSGLSAVVAPFVLGRWTPMIGFGLLLGVWVASTVLLTLWQKLREQPLSRWRAWMAQQPGSWYGMLLAHLGVAVFVIGVTVVNGFQVEKDLRMEPGQSAEIAGMRVRFDGVRDVRGPNYVAARGTLVLTRGERQLAVLQPERRNYLVSRMPMTETAIDRGFTRDLYVSLGEPLGGAAWSVRVYYKPFVGWIWGGCLLMALGGVLAVLDRRYRAKARVAAPSAVVPRQDDAASALARQPGTP
jgi:cytochrome c-type biogenesis protein CcmF